MHNVISRSWKAVPLSVRVGAAVCVLLVVAALKAFGLSWFYAVVATLFIGIVLPLAVGLLRAAVETWLRPLVEPRPKLALKVRGAEGGAADREGFAAVASGDLADCGKRNR